MKKNLFCNIAWMKYYKGITAEDRPVNGGAWVLENNDAHESNNFSKTNTEGEKDVCLGFVETKWTNGIDRNQLHIEKIVGKTMKEIGDDIEDVLVIWCSKNPENKFTSIIGWYKKSTVFRKGKVIEKIHKNERYEQHYFMKAKLENCVLLPLKERNNKQKWFVPRRNKENLTYGFGQANIWFADKRNENIELKRYVNKIVKQIEEYMGENLIK